MSFCVYRRNLPHWRSDGATYFVTWCLARPQPALTPRERTLVVRALRHFDGRRYDLLAWVVMDDHVHVVVRPAPGIGLAEVTHSWKSFTAHQLTRRSGRRAPVWQDESYDRIVRDDRALRTIVRYVLLNPGRRWRHCGSYPWVSRPRPGVS
jgi:REP-associated tyrosine transposase